MSLTLAFICTLLGAQGDVVATEPTLAADAGESREEAAPEVAAPEEVEADESTFVLGGNEARSSLNFWHFEAGLEAALQPATDGSNFFVYLPFLRAGKTFEGSEGWLSFIDTRVALRFNGNGTDRVAVNDLVGSLAARYGIGPYLGKSFLRIHPYAFAGAQAGAGTSTRRVDDKSARRWLVEGGVFGGVGITATLFFWTTRIDCSLGNRNLSGDARAAISTGVIF